MRWAGQSVYLELEKLFRLPIDLETDLLDTAEIEGLIRANVDKTVTIVDADGKTQNLLVRCVDDERFVCDIAAEMTRPPACAYLVRFTNVREVRDAEEGPGNNA